MTLAVSLPFHVYGFVDRSFVSVRDGFEPAVWFGLTVPANRALGLTVLLECGAVYRELPPHAFAFTHTPAQDWSLAAAQAHDCFGGDAQALEYAYLRELPVRALPTQWPGWYLFTLEFANNGFSRHPEQSKAFHALRLENGRLTFQPGHRVWFAEPSFTITREPPSWLIRHSHVWSAEPWPV